MTTITPRLMFFLNLAKVQSVMARRFDSSLGGLGHNEFVILYHLSQAEQGKMRRSELADAIGLTASGVTRLLLPMEKIGLIKKEADEHDARVSYVRIAPGGKHKLADALERAELLAEDVLPTGKAKLVKDCSELLDSIVS